MRKLSFIENLTLYKNREVFIEEVDPKAFYPVKENKFFVIIIPSYNNLEVCEKNLRSLFSQNYDNYRVIYTDDASTDGTYEKVKQVIQELGEEKRVTLLRNSENKGAMYNHYRAIHLCRDEEIVVSVDGDDWLAHDGVLSYLNQVYANPDVWLTYGSNLYYPNYQFSRECRAFSKKILTQKGYRHHPWVTSQLRTFYAGLFKKIKKEDLMKEGKFLEVACDFGYMYPLLEMSGGRYRFISEVLYIYNIDHPMNDYKIHQDKLKATIGYLLTLPSYKPLKEAPF